MHACYPGSRACMATVGTMQAPVKLCFLPVELRFPPVALRFPPFKLCFPPVKLRFGLDYPVRSARAVGTLHACILPRPPCLQGNSWHHASPSYAAFPPRSRAACVYPQARCIILSPVKLCLSPVELGLPSSDYLSLLGLPSSPLFIARQVSSACM